jgi:outer membrane protein assembly factor BamB
MIISPGRDSAAQGASAKLFAASPGDLTLALDPQRGVIAYGPHSPPGEPPRFRAVDLATKQVLWEALQGQSWIAELGSERVRVAGPNVYVANGRALVALDRASGVQRWGAHLPDKVQEDNGSGPERGASIADPFPPGGRGAVAVATIDNVLSGFDRDTGQPLHTRAFEKKIEIEPIESAGTILLRRNFPFTKLEIINPGYGVPLVVYGEENWNSDFNRAVVRGTVVLAQFESLGEDDREGVAVIDGASGRPHVFDEMTDLEEDIWPVTIAPRVFCARKDGDELYAGPGGVSIAAPVPQHRIVAMCAGGPTLFLLMCKAQGTRTRRVVGLDPGTLRFKFDCGEAGTEPDDNWQRQMASDGYSVVFPTTPHDDESQCELRSVDTSTGRTLWTRAVGAWRAHWFLGGVVVCRSRGQLLVLRPDNGKTVAQFPLEAG